MITFTDKSTTNHSVLICKSDDRQELNNLTLQDMRKLGAPAWVTSQDVKILPLEPYLGLHRIAVHRSHAGRQADTRAIGPGTKISLNLLLAGLVYLMVRYVTE